MRPIQVVIIEDETLTAEDLAATIAEVDKNVTIVKFLTNVEDAVAYFKSKPSIDLVFSDIQLGDGKSFEIFEQCNTTTPIIFCTAYDMFAMEAFNTAGIDYVLKPFSNESVEKALNKYKALFGNKINTENIAAGIQSLRTHMQSANIPSIVVYQKDKIIPIAGEEIALFCIENENVKVYTNSNHFYFVNYTLEQLELKFQPFFYRVNRQFLINKKAIVQAHSQSNRKLLLELNIKQNTDITVGKEKATSFLNWLNG